VPGLKQGSLWPVVSCSLGSTSAMPENNECQAQLHPVTTCMAVFAMCTAKPVGSCCCSACGLHGTWAPLPMLCWASNCCHEWKQGAVCHLSHAVHRGILQCIHGQCVPRDVLAQMGFVLGRECDCYIGFFAPYTVYYMGLCCQSWECFKVVVLCAVVQLWL